jgi:hypothetical protein
VAQPFSLGIIDVNMKSAICTGIIAFSALLTGCGHKNSSSDSSATQSGDVQIRQKVVGTSNIDDKLAAKAEVVLRARLISLDGAGKDARFRVQVLQVLKNESGVKLAHELLVGAYRSKEGVPVGGKFTLYLERYNQTNTEPWELIGASHNTE